MVITPVINLFSIPIPSGFDSKVQVVLRFLLVPWVNIDVALNQQVGIRVPCQVLPMPLQAATFASNGKRALADIMQASW